MNGYTGKHTSSVPWQISASSSGHSPRHRLKNRRRRVWLILSLILLAALVAWPFLEARLIRVERTSVSSEDLPADIGHLHVVYVTDIHYGHFFSDAALTRLVSKINALRPDIVLFGGDYATDSASAVSFFKRLPSIHSRYAMLGVIGECDRGESDLDLTLLEDAMREKNVIPLINSVSRIPLGNSYIYVAGVDDYQSGRPDPDELGKNVSADDFVILLSHNPSVIPSLHESPDKNGKLGWFDLALFGHTHGGQMLPFASLLDVGSDVDDRYRSGWITENRADILISNGIGTSGVPMRMFCPPQIHYIDISTK